MLYEENAKHSKYKSKIKQTTVYVQVIASMRQTLIEYKVVIVTGGVCKGI